MLSCSGSRRFYASIWRYCYDKDSQTAERFDPQPVQEKRCADAQILMRNYMMERFLERISLSSYRDKFILKGGMLVAAMVGPLGLPMAAAWLVGKVQDLRYAIQDAVYG